MDRSITQALNGLIPTFTGPLPPELRELTASLLAQSRSKASSLKAEEEIARSYACANLACERLKQTLALPKIQSRPPCPPKAYLKLYRFLDTALPAGRRGSARPAKLNVPVSALDSSPSRPRTPTKGIGLKPSTTRRRILRRPKVAFEVPDWAMPTIRQLCTEFGADTAPPHIFAGVSSILTLPPPIPVDSTPKSAEVLGKVKISALIIAVYFIVTTRLAGVGTPPNEYSRQKGEALAIIKAGGDSAELEDLGDADVDTCMREIRDRGWTLLDWFANIREGTGLGAGGTEDDEGEASQDEAEKLPVQLQSSKGDVDVQDMDKDYLQAGLGTMMQDKFDYLSEARRSDYQEWKREILLRIDELENSQRMDVSTG